MPKAAEDVAAELKKFMKKRKNAAFTIPWANWYELCDRKHWTDSAAETIYQAGIEAGLVIGFGNEVVTVMKDEDVAPLEP